MEISIMAIRKDKGFNQTYVAEYLGISRNSLSKKEKHPGSFLFSEVKKLEKLYGVPISLFRCD